MVENNSILTTSVMDQWNKIREEKDKLGRTLESKQGQWCADCGKLITGEQCLCRLEATLSKCNKCDSRGMIKTGEFSAKSCDCGYDFRRTEEAFNRNFEIDIKRVGDKIITGNPIFKRKESDRA